MSTTKTTTTTTFATTCSSFPFASFADMHDGDVKNITVTKDGVLTMSQDYPVPWDLTVDLDPSDCTAIVDFSKSKKPAHPPVPLKIRLRKTSVGTNVLEFTDPSGTINPDSNYPLNVWTTEHEMLPAKGSCITSLPPTSFQDMHDGDVKIVSISNGMLTMGQTGIWNLTTPLDSKDCKALIDFSKTSKPAKPPVPLVVSVAVAFSESRRPGEGSVMSPEKKRENGREDGSGRNVIMTWTDPSKTISTKAWYPLNLWMDVTNCGEKDVVVGMEE